MNAVRRCASNIDPADLFKCIGRIRSGTNYNERVNVIDHDDRFISTLSDDTYYVGYYHPSKMHSATIEGGNLPGCKTFAKSIANPGEWAIAAGQNRLSGNNRTYYNAC
jgi:hypothetical protein